VDPLKASVIRVNLRNLRLKSVRNGKRDRGNEQAISAFCFSRTFFLDMQIRFGMGVPVNQKNAHPDKRKRNAGNDPIGRIRPSLSGKVLAAVQARGEQIGPIPSTHQQPNHKTKNLYENRQR
jgi:hypothetical protein